MVRFAVYKRFAVLRDMYSRCGAHGMCRACYINALKKGTRTEPAPRKNRRPIMDGQACRDCGAPMVTVKIYRKDRVRYRSLGYIPLSGHGMCNNCYMRASFWGTLPNPAPWTGAPRRHITRRGQGGPMGPAELARLRATVGLTP